MSSRLLCLAVLVLMALTAGTPAATTGADTPTPAPPPYASIAFLKTRIDPGGLQWMLDQVSRDGVDLNTSGIYALDKDRVFLFGGLSTNPGTFRSVLLRSGDGGLHWAEVMPPVMGSDIQQILFVGQEQGWALVLWTVEGPGPVLLYHTADAGVTWAKLCDVPKKTALAYPYRMVFPDTMHGQIDMNESDQMVILTTSDGGQTWSETGNVPGQGQLTASPDADQAAVATYEAQNPAPRMTESTGQDGSVWKLDTSDSDAPAIVVRRRLAGEEGNWSFAVALPSHFDYVDGQVVSR